MNLRKQILLNSKVLFQILLLVFSILLVAEGLWGSQFAPKNLTTLFVWVHYRGLLVFLLLLAGNFFCMSCPFIFVRNALRVLVAPAKLWPKKLQNKWIGIALFIGILFAYEYWGLWSKPSATAWLIVGYFAAAIAVDLTFKKAAFCKYLCPIGQFNFLSSTLSPKEVKARNLSVCDSCTTYDCLKGVKKDEEIIKRGCETHLFIPKKKGNLDCTFCMDCVDACPHNNVSIQSVTPSQELWDDSHRSGVGKLSERFDYLALIIVFTFGGLLNAFAMVAPAHQLKAMLKDLFSIHNEAFLLAAIFLLFLIILPLLVISKRNYRLIPSMLPLGFSIWLAHYSFHLLTGLLTFIPLLTKKSFPIHLMGVPLKYVMPTQFGFLFLGLVGSMILVSIMDKKSETRLRWWSTHILLFIMAVWIMSLPMDMRGTFVGLAP